MKSFTEEFKKVAVQKFFSRGNRSVESICNEVGVSTHSLYSWSKKYGKTDPMKKNNRTPQSLSAGEKMKAVMDFENLPGEKQGEFLRSSGLMSDHLVQWKNIWEKALESNGEAVFSRTERLELLRKMKELETDLLRKDRALAETTALLVLKKKADLIWGTLPDESV